MPNWCHYQPASLWVFAFCQQTDALQTKPSCGSAAPLHLALRNTNLVNVSTDTGWTRSSWKPRGLTGAAVKLGMLVKLKGNSQKNSAHCNWNTADRAALVLSASAGLIPLLFSTLRVFTLRSTPFLVPGKLFFLLFLIWSAALKCRTVDVPQNIFCMDIETEFF